MIKIVWETHKLTRYQSKEFSYVTFLHRANAKSLLVQLARANIIHSQCEIEVLFSTLKISPFPLAQSINQHIRALVLIPCHRCEKSARESCHSHHLIRQRENIHARAPDMCVDPRGYMKSGWRNLF